MSIFALSQLLVGFAFICDISSFQFRKRGSILIVLIVSTVLTAIHYFLLANATAGCLMLLAAGRFTTAYRYPVKAWMWFFILLAAVVVGVTYQKPVNVLAFCASALGTYASFQKDDKKLRRWMSSGTICWIAHNAIIGSPAAVLLEIFFLSSNVVGYWRYYIRR